MIVSDNGTEFTSNAILDWGEKTRVKRHYIAPGKPKRDTATLAAGSSVHWTDAFSGLTFNGRMRNEPLNDTLFVGIDHARDAVARWTHTCNTERPHSALGYQAPAIFAAQFTAMGDQLCAPELLRRSPVARSAQPRQIHAPALASAG